MTMDEKTQEFKAIVEANGDDWFSLAGDYHDKMMSVIYFGGDPQYLLEDIELSNYNTKRADVEHLFND